MSTIEVEKPFMPSLNDVWSAILAFSSVIGIAGFCSGIAYFIMSSKMSKKLNDMLDHFKKDFLESNAITVKNQCSPLSKSNNEFRANLEEMKRKLESLESVFREYKENTSAARNERSRLYKEELDNMQDGLKDDITKLEGLISRHFESIGQASIGLAEQRVMISALKDRIDKLGG